MQIHVDYNPAPKDSFFISVHFNDREAISFDNTYKGHRIIKQELVEIKSFPENTKFNQEWNTIVLEDGKFVQEYHVQWVDQDKLDWLNGEVWETMWEKPISDDVTKKLLRYSQLVSDNYKDLHKFSDEVKKFEELLSKEIKKIS
jgi:hypothetical protein